MSGNTFGRLLRVTTWGESHGEAVGVVIDGVPAGLPLNEDDIQVELDRRKPGESEVSTSRKEKDEAQILSGVFEGKTIGSPISIMIQNVDVDSSPYEKIKTIPRPGSADLTYRLKYGHVDYRGGGRSSGRETVGRVAAGAIAKKLLAAKGVDIVAHTVEAAGVSLDKSVDLDEIKENVEENSMRCGDPETAEKMRDAVVEASEEGDSTGGIVEAIVVNVPSGLGEPVFDKLDAKIAQALMSIGAVKGVEIGLGFEAARHRGSEVNDEFEIVEDKVVPKTNNAGGILGGISTGAPLIVRIAVKPTSSISKPQQTVDLEKMEETEIKLEGRHDPNICPRIVPVVESMLALVLADLMLQAGKINPDQFEGS